MSQEVIKRTQNLLGKYVTKPPLTEKLLGKPPFRFLYDVINVVISDTGFLRGLLSEDELSSDNIKDKDAKIAFLQKVIDATSLATQENLEVRPSKIVAGHEADKTNLLLQAIAKGIDKKIDSTAAVEQVLSGAKPQNSDKSKSDPKKSSVKSKVAIKPRNPKDTKEGKEVRTSPSKKTSTSTPSRVTRTPPADRRPVKDVKLSPANNKESKPRIGSQGKDRRNGAKPKSTDPTIKKREKKDKTESKPSKSRAGSRMELRDEGKENDPPEEAAQDATENPPNGNVDDEEVPIRPKSERIRPSGRKDDEPTDDDDDPMALLEGETLPEDEDEGLVLGEDVPPVDLELGAGEGDAVDNDGPNSLLQLDSGDRSGDLNIDLNDATESHPDPDPLILKAMNRGDILNDDDGANPHDSGVGSLESPKPTARIESLPNTAQAKTPRSVQQTHSPVPPVPSTPGPGMRPISAYHPDMPAENFMLPPDDNNQETEQVERPRTGMGIRPRTGRKSARPASARPAPPKVRERKEIPQEEIPRPPTGKPVANVILDAEGQGLDDDEDDEIFTVGNAEAVLDDEMSAEPTLTDSNLEKMKQDLLVGDQDAKGILVAQILDTKKELEDGRREAFSPETPGQRRVPIEQAFPQDASKRKEKEMIQKDVEKLTSSIQALTRSVNPLAKMLDYLQEDLDSMQKELETWTEENKTLTQSLKAEQSMTEQQQEPLKVQLEEMEAAIFDQQDRISAVKSNIMRNDERIARLLAGVNLNS